MKINNQVNFIQITESASSLHSLIADGQYRPTSLGRNTWFSLIASCTSFNDYCNREGFNTECTWKNRSKARIGILGNNEDDCTSCNFRVGFGTGGLNDDSNTCGNHACVHIWVHIYAVKQTENYARLSLVLLVTMKMTAFPVTLE